MLKTFAERCAEPIVKLIARYQVVPRYIEGTVTDIVGEYRKDIEAFPHNLEFLWTADGKRKRPITTMEELSVGDDKSEIYCSEIIGKLKEKYVVNLNYDTERSGGTLRMRKK